MNRAAQVVGAMLGSLGLYAIWFVLPLLPGVITNPLNWIVLVILLWLAIGTALIITSYRVVFRQSKQDLKNLSLYSALIVWMFTDDLIEPLLNQWRVFEDQRHRDLLSSGLAIVLAVATFKVLKRVTSKNMQPNQAL